MYFLVRVFFIFFLLLANTHAADVPFTASWVAPTMYINGNPGTPTDYTLYVCDQGITKTPWLTGSVTCAGNMTTYITTETSYSGVYTSLVDAGSIYFKVAARDAAGNESPLSNLAVIIYSTLSLTFQPPAGFQLNNGCVTIINTP